MSSARLASPEHDERFDAALVADLRAVTIRYPNDRFVTELVADLNATSPRFAALWERGEVAHHESAQKTLRHPPVVDVTVDCDVLTVDGAEVHVIVYTAEPGSSSAAKLERLATLSQAPHS